MINYLYKNNEWFRAKVNKLWHYKGDTLKGTEFAFVDALGRKYFKFIDVLFVEGLHGTSSILF